MYYKLYVFIGKPGVGKSTLIKQVFSGSTPHLDVAPFIKHHAVNGLVSEEKTINGYRALYDYYQIFYVMRQQKHAFSELCNAWIILIQKRYTEDCIVIFQIHTLPYFKNRRFLIN